MPSFLTSLGTERVHVWQLRTDVRVPHGPFHFGSHLESVAGSSSDRSSAEVLAAPSTRKALNCSLPRF